MRFLNNDELHQFYFKAVFENVLQLGDGNAHSQNKLAAQGHVQSPIAI
jgi:hypothetical protein